MRTKFSAIINIHVTKIPSNSNSKNAQVRWLNDTLWPNGFLLLYPNGAYTPNSRTAPTTKTGDIIQLMDESSIVITAPPSITFRDITLAAAIFGESSDIKKDNTKSANLHQLQRFHALYSHKHSADIAYDQTIGAIRVTQCTKLNLQLENYLITKHRTNNPHLAHDSKFNIITAIGHHLGSHSEHNIKWTSHQA